MKKLPQNIVDHLNKNLMFNKFGLVNIASLKASTGTTLEDDDLKERIQERFGKEMVNGTVEFVKSK